MKREKDPFSIFSRLYSKAQKTGIREPGTMTLATTGPGGRPSVRIVLLKEAGEDGFTFFTNFESRKSREMEKNPHVSAVFHWAELGSQVRIEGGVTKITDAESDRYFSSRPRGSQISAWASKQSQEIPSATWLENEMKRYEEMYSGKKVPRPPHWGGYRLKPDRIEFWTEGRDRLHERIEFVRDGKLWDKRLLSP